MFTSKSQLKKRTPENGTDREDYLSLLVDEYINTKSFGKHLLPVQLLKLNAKCQVLANLANFAYDPINYAYIRTVGVLDIFLHTLKNENHEKLLHFAISGICNLCIDPENIQYFLTTDALKTIFSLLQSNHDETLADIITICIYLFNSAAKTSINFLEHINDFEKLEKSKNKRISNLASIFLTDIKKCQ